MKKAYARAGVDVDLGNKVKKGIQALVQSTHSPAVLGKIGGFGGLYNAKFPGYKNPVLVSSVDGVGTKLKVATLTNRHDTIGQDLVNHCVNDIAVIGAEPLFFLDYIGTGRLDPDVFKQILKGLSKACAACGCALVGGETAQMPGVYHGEDYDLVGCIVGIVDRSKMLDGRSIKPGDVIIGLPASGLHTNGFSLAREILFNKCGFKVGDTIPGSRETVGSALLKVHVNYLPTLRKLHAKVKIKGLAHITGGGLIDNLPRVLPENAQAVIQLGSWPISPFFRFLAEESHVGDDELYQVYNMGIGMTVIVSPADAEKVLKLTKSYRIGSIVKGPRGVKLQPSTKKK
ncbi:MAG: phosphoribosylformylglycinamidine cyclo-ligase [Verrucomicrobia bacterium Tous-C9LFEB]|nr:MAG: phosphoribosylformylglycinamidine cyclo-ligase [Verrucomicrobia bacterium Tous-C9LFEB]